MKDDKINRINVQLLLLKKRLESQEVDSPCKDLNAILMSQLCYLEITEGF